VDFPEVVGSGDLNLGLADHLIPSIVVLGVLNDFVGWE
jgi:hypothetical protein